MVIGPIFAEEALACGALDGLVGESRCLEHLVDRLALVDLALVREGL